MTTPAPGSESSLGARVASSARWVVLMRVGSMAAIWIQSIALARLLVPSQYGLAGMAMVLLSTLAVFQESGLHAALIQRRDRVQEAVNAATAYTPIVGVSLLGLCLVAAPLAGRFFHHGEVTDLVRALSVVFLLRAVSQIPISLLQKEFRFRAFTIAYLLGSVLQTGVAIALAAEGAGAWSAIGGLIAFETWIAAAMWPICPMRPHPWQATWRDLRELLAYGRNIVGVNVANIVYSYVDITVVGRFLGAASLGAYTIGRQTGKQPVANVTWATSQVVFPAYSKLQGEPERLRRAYLRSLRFVTVLSIPLGLGLASVSGEFVRVVYGGRWAAAAPVLAIMALMGLVLSVTATMGEVLKATGRTAFFFWMSALQTILVVILVLFFYRFGIAAVAAAVASSVTVVGALVTREIGRILRIAPADWARALLPPLLAGGAMVAAIFAAKAGLRTLTHTSSLPALVALILLGGVGYLVALRLIAPDRLREFVDEVVPVVGRRGRGARGGSEPERAEASPGALALPERAGDA